MHDEGMMIVVGVPVASLVVGPGVVLNNNFVGQGDSHRPATKGGHESDAGKNSI